MRMPDTLKRLERIMGRKFTLEEHKRLTRIRDSLQLRDDDAVWTLFLALEYQRTFYTKLPDRIESLTTDLLKKGGRPPIKKPKRRRRGWSAA